MLPVVPCGRERIIVDVVPKFVRMFSGPVLTLNVSPAEKTDGSTVAVRVAVGVRVGVREGVAVPDVVSRVRYWDATQPVWVGVCTLYQVVPETICDSFSHVTIRP